MKITTIKLKTETKSRLDNLRTHPKESYNELIERVLSLINICRFNPEQARQKIRKIEAIKNLNKSNRPGNS